MGNAWAFTKDEAVEAARPKIVDRVLRRVFARTWRRGYDAAIADVTSGRLRGHIIGPNKLKRPFGSKDDALGYASEHGHGNVVAYQCEVCGLWHLATVRRTAAPLASGGYVGG